MATDVATLISNREKYADNIVAQAQNTLDSITRMAEGIEIRVQTPLIPGYGWTNIVGAAKAEFAALKPERPTGLTDTLPIAPIIPTLTIPAPPQAITLPVFTTTAPVLTFPTAPNLSVPNLPAEPTLTEIAIPSSPSYNLPTVPGVSSITIPAAPVLDIPVFSVSSPTTVLNPPTAEFAFAEVEYASAMLDSAKAKLLADLANGGYGIDDADEVRLVGRAQDRAAQQGVAAIQEARRAKSASGFFTPPGSLYKAQSIAIETMQNAASEINREVYLKRADLYVQNRQFTITEVRAYETMLINYHMAKMERALNFSKAVADLSLKVFELSVARFNAQWDAYEKAGRFFESRVRAELAKLEVYKTTLEGVKISVEVDAARINLYKAQLDGVQTIQQIYKVDVDAAVAKEGLNRQKLEVFKARVDAINAQVRVNELQFSAYKAGVEGQTARMNAFRIEADSFASKVQGAKAQADVSIATVELQNKIVQTTLENYRLQIEGYRTQLGVIVERIKVNRDVYQVDISAFEAIVKAIGDAYQLQLQEVSKNAEVNIAVAKLNIEDARLKIEKFVKEVELRKSAGQYVASFYADRIGAVMNTLQAVITQAA